MEQKNNLIRKTEHKGVQKEARERETNIQTSRRGSFKSIRLDPWPFRKLAIKKDIFTHKA